MTLRTVASGPGSQSGGSRKVPAEKLKLNGIWERRNRNPLVGAIVLVLGIGAFYFLIQSFLLNAYVMIDGGRPDLHFHGNVQSRLRFFYERYQMVILIVLAATEFGVIFLTPILLIRRWHTRQVDRYLRYDRFPVFGVLLGAVGALALLPSVEYVAGVMYSFFPALKEVGDSTRPIIKVHSTPMLLLTIFAIAVTPAICEETLFRGYLQRTLERRVRAPWHFLLSGLLFALFHQQVLSLPSLFLVGIYLGFIYTHFRSIYPGMFAHFSYNGAIILLTNVQPVASPFFDRGDNFSHLSLFLSLGLFILIIVLMFLVRARFPGRRDETEM